jgi:hypothetical protein
MAIVDPVTEVVAFEVRGKLGLPNHYGHSIFGKSVYGLDMPLAGVYQMRRKYATNNDKDFVVKGGNMIVRMRFYRPTNPNSAGQQAMRNKLRDAVNAWVALTAGEKSVYNQSGKRRNQRGYDIFKREYMRTH